MFLAKLFGGVSGLKELLDEIYVNCWCGRIFFSVTNNGTFVIVETWSVGVFAFLVLKL